MRIKMQPRADGLCVKCRNGQVTEDVDGGVSTFCNSMMVPWRIARPVVRCTDFEDRQNESEHEMRTIAWTLRTDARGKVGFAPPDKKKD